MDWEAALESPALGMGVKASWVGRCGCGGMRRKAGIFRGLPRASPGGAKGTKVLRGSRKWRGWDKRGIVFNVPGA